MSVSVPMQNTCSTDHYTTVASQHESEHQSFSVNPETSSLDDQQRYECSVTSSQQPHANKQQFTCLYTKHKTQKRKIWLDGRLVVHGCGKVVLYAASPAPGLDDPALDQTELLRSDANAIRTNLQSNMETEKYLITIEGTWLGTPNVTATLSATTSSVSNGMRKVLSNKFRRPAAVAPPPLSTTTTSLLEQQRKRRRPLQPGELVRRYYPDSITNDMLHADQNNPVNNPSRRIASVHDVSIQYLNHQQQNQWNLLPPHETNTATETMHPPAMHYGLPPHHPDQHSAMTLTVPRPMESAPPGHVVAQAQTPLLPLPSASTHNSSVADMYRVHSSSLPKPLEQPSSVVQHSAPLVTVRPATSATLFASNGFNKSCFYGEDFEEDEESDEQSKPFQLQRLILPNSADEEPHCETGGDEAIVGSIEGGKCSSRSTSQLLALFEVPGEPEELSQSKEICCDGFVLPVQDFSSSDESDS